MSDLRGILLGAGLGIFAALLIAGCGGDDTLSKEQYASRLSAMCEDFSAREEQIGEPRSQADLVEKGPQILDAYEKAIFDEVRKLKAPDEIGDQADRMAELAGEQRNVLSGLIDAAKADDAVKLQELASKNAKLNEEAGSIARELGAQSCG